MAHPARGLAALLALFVVLAAAPPAAAQDGDLDLIPPAVEAEGEAIQERGEAADEALGDGEGLGADHGGDDHAGEDDHGGGHHGALPPLWLVAPFVVLLLMIATGPLFYPHFWHHHYPKIAVALGALTAAYYLAVMGDFLPIFHAAEEYFAFIALLGSLYVASGCILIKTDFAGTPRANAILLLVGSVLANFIGTTGASMLLIRPYMRLNAGRLKAYHIIFFIFTVSNVGRRPDADRRPPAVPGLPPWRPVLLDGGQRVVHLAPDDPRDHRRVLRRRQPEQAREHP